MNKKGLFIFILVILSCCGCFNTNNNNEIPVSPKPNVVDEDVIDIGNAKISGLANQKYTGASITLKIILKIGNKTLKENVDYKLIYQDNIKIGTAKITINGIGNYTGTKVVTFKIVESKPNAKITCSNKVYNGETQVIATCEGGVISNASKINVGSYTVTCKGDNKHYDAPSKLCNISAQSLANATVSSISNQTYTGKAIVPSFTVKIGSKTLIKETDYTVSYGNNINVGTANVTIKGKNNYTGTKAITFAIIAKEVLPTGVKLNKTSLTLVVGKTEKLTATLTPTTVTNKKLTWTSGNTSVAMVDSSGNIKAVKAGSALIAVKTANGLLATCTVTVVAKAMKIKVATMNAGQFTCGSKRSKLYGQCTKTLISDYTSFFKNNGFNIIGYQEGGGTKAQQASQKAGLNNIINENPGGSVIGIATKYTKVSTAYQKYAVCSTTSTVAGASERRGYVKMVVKINNVNISVYTTHLTTASDCKPAQWQELANILKKDSNPIILTGDFNFSSISYINKYLKPVGMTVVAHDTINSTYMDSILIKESGSNGIARIRFVSETTLKTQAIYTDHNTVVATLEILG